MKRYLLAAAAILALGACTEFTEQDRALLVETHGMAKAAKEQSITATEEAARARADANKAAGAAKEASDKADRIFRQSQNK